MRAVPCNNTALIICQLTQASTSQQQQQQQQQEGEASRGGKRERENGSSSGRGDDPIVSDAELMRKMGHGSGMVKSMRMQKKAKRRSG